MTDRLVFNFKIEQSDYSDSVMCMTFGIQKWKRYLILFTWIICLSLFVLSMAKVITISPTVYACALLVVVIVGTAFLSVQINIFKYRKVYQKGRNIKRQIVVDDKGITFKNRSTEESGFNSWEEISRIQETEDQFIIGVNARDAVMLPKRAFLIEKDLDDFREIASAHIRARFMEM